MLCKAPAVLAAGGLSVNSVGKRPQRPVLLELTFVLGDRKQANVTDCLLYLHSPPFFLHPREALCPWWSMGAASVPSLASSFSPLGPVHET